MVSNTRDRNIDSSRREDSRKGQVDRCEVINVRPHVNPYPADKDFNVVDVQLIDRPRVEGQPLTIEYVKLNSLLLWHGLFQGHPWNARIGDMVYIYWLAEREALVLGLCASVEQEPVCRSQADDQQQEFVLKLCPWEEPSKNADGNYVIFPPPKHPVCFKWWPKTRDTMWIFDCLEGHNTPSCCAAAPCNSLDDHLSSTCIKVFSDISPTAVDKPWRFKILHHCGSYLYFDNDAVWRIAGKLSGNELGFIHHYTNGKIEIHSPIEDLLTAPLIKLDADTEILETAPLIKLDGNVEITGTCTHQVCSCEAEGGAVVSGTGTGTEQAVEHGITNCLGEACCPASVTPVCPGGTCTVGRCDETYVYVTCTVDIDFKLYCGPAEDGWGGWEPCF